MLKSKVFQRLIEIKREFLSNLRPEMMEKWDGKSFTRRSPLTMKRLVMIILRASPFSLQIRLDDFFKEIGNKEETVSKQSFSTRRSFLDPNIIKKSFELTVETMSSCEDLILFKGKYRTCAIDGSIVILDNALLEAFGGSGKNNDCASALASLCYDPLNEMILDAGLYTYGTSERLAALAHYERVESLPLPEDAANLYIQDRGYPSKELLAHLMDNGHFFLMRVRRRFNVDFDLSGDDEVVSFKHDSKTYQVRVFKVTLDSGEVETLISNLPEEDLSSEEVGAVYFERWGIEIKFDSLKNNLELENFSGRSEKAVYQDFWAKLDLSNTLSALEYSTNDVIEEKTADNQNKHKQTTNESRLVTKFSDKYIEVLITEDPDERLELFDELIAEIARRPVEVKPNRKFERKKPRKKKFSDRHKRSLR